MYEKVVARYVWYERHEGARHVCEIFERRSGARYCLKVDGVFFASSHSICDIRDEIVDIVERFRWISYNPCFA